MVKNKLFKSLHKNAMQENEELHQQADQAKHHEAAITVIEDYEKVIRSKNKCILNVTFRQGKVLKIYGDMLKGLNIRQSTLYFK